MQKSDDYLVNMQELEKASQKSLSPSVFNFVSGGAADETTLQDNVLFYSRLKLLPHVLRGIQQPNTSTKVIGHTLTSPLLIAPMAFQKLVHPLGEHATLGAANQCQTTMIVSTYTTTLLSDIKAQALAPLWFQVYLLKDRKVTQELIQKAEILGFKALVLTVDTPVYGIRDRETQHPLQEKITVPDLLKVVPKLSSARALSALLDSHLIWDDIAWIKSFTRLPIFLKGVLRADDALKAQACGVSGLILSNHGGRQLDTTPHAITVLPQIVKVLDQKIDILIDGGIRRGTDIFKALALGAKAVLVGRPILWGLSVGGKQGVLDVLNQLMKEFEQTMILCGCQNVEDIVSDYVDVSQ